MKNQKIIMIVLSISLVAGIIFDGIMIYDRYFKIEKKPNNLVVDKNNEDSQEEDENHLNKEEVKKILDNYVKYSGLPIALFFQEKLTEELKMKMAIKKVMEENTTLSKYSCSELYADKINKGEDSLEYEIKLDGVEYAFCYKQIPLIGVDYISADKAYKYLFGKNEVLPKKDFTHINVYDYIEQIDKFIQLDTQWGYSSLKEIYGIKDFELRENTLIIKAIYVKFTMGDADNLIPNFDSNLEIPYEETLKENFEQSLIDKYKEQINAIEFVFELEDNHYILKSIN